jgi:UDPglucose 6-dehydrogenase
MAALAFHAASKADGIDPTDERNEMRIAIIGTGYVGLVTGACFSEIGHTVICQDSDTSKIDILQNGDMPIYEPYLEYLVKKNKDAGRISFTKDFANAVKPSEVVFICVGTPPLENGEADLSAVEAVSREIARVSDSYKLVAEKSTVPVQTGEWVEKTIRIYSSTNNEFDVASNPEFLREGSAVEDFLHPDRIVAGIKNGRAEKILRDLYTPIIHRQFNCPVHGTCPSVEPIPFIVTDIKSAELIKHASNSLLATKISFINAVADICEKTGANIKDVAHGIGLDKRIGKSFLEAGIGFGGFCFPKDLQAFIRIAEKSGYNFGLLKEVEKINNERVSLVIKKIRQTLWVLKGKTIGILGLSFKPNTDDIRFAPALEIIRQLLKEGATIRAYDEQAMKKAKAQIPAVIYCADPYEVARGAECLVVCTEWDEFRNLNFEELKGLMKRPFILDGRNIFTKQKILNMGFEYQGIGM